VFEHPPPDNLFLFPFSSSLGPSIAVYLVVVRLFAFALLRCSFIGVQTFFPQASRYATTCGVGLVGVGRGGGSEEGLHLFSFDD